MATLNFSNGATSTINTTINSSATTVAVASASGFPAVPFLALIAAEGSNKDEIVLVTANASGTLTIVRAVEKVSDGTQVAQAHTAGARISHVLTAGGLDDAATDFMAYRYF